MKSIYEHIIVIGYGVIAGNILKTINKLSGIYNYSYEYIEYEVYPFSSANKYADENSISRVTIIDKENVFRYLISNNMRTLIISANNNYIFPKDIIKKKNIDIINFHNALLPDLPGRNAATWAIFEKRQKTGITWHFVSEEIDAGEIIIQKNCDIANDTKAYELVGKQMQLALIAFEECIDDILIGNVNTIKMRAEFGRKVYKSYETPADGYFRITDSGEDIYTLLRAVDYGKNKVFDPIIFNYEGQEAEVINYKKEKKCNNDKMPNTITFDVNDDEVLVIRYKTIVKL